MDSPSIIVGLAVNLLVPFLGVVAYLALCYWMWRTKVPSPPYVSYFILFAHYGACLLVLLTALFWEWSGMASLGFVYLLVISPFVVASLLPGLFWRLKSSRFHLTALIASVVFSGLMFMVACTWAATILMKHQ